MNEKTMKVTGAFASLTLLASAGVIATATTAQAESATDFQTAHAAKSSGSIESIFVSAPCVDGTFSYSQDELSSNKTIAGVFCKAAATLCSSLPDYGMACAQSSISVAGDIGNAFSATVDEMADQEGTASYTMACACASNLPGGGAIANAEVEGVSLESIAKLAQAK